jgi:hypothetical protein
MGVGAQATRRVAVIGIHGVGEHAPGDTARAIVRQLQHTHPDVYGAFEEVPLKLAVDARELGRLSREEDHPKGIERLQAGFHSVFKWRRLQAAARAGAVPDPEESPRDVQFSHSLLVRGDTYKSEYATVRLSGTSKIQEGADTQVNILTDVDVYELFWSDLSHSFGTGALAAFGQIVQLLVHLASLGRTAVATTNEAGMTQTRRWWWRVFYRLNAASYWLLSTPILVGNLLFVFLAALLVPALIGNAVKPATTALVGLIAAALIGGAIYGSFGRTTVGRFCVAVAASASLILGAAVGAVWWFWLDGAITRTIDGSLVMAWLEIPLLLLIGDSVARRYDALRPGAYIVWYALAGALALWMAAVLVLGWNPDGSAGQSGSLYSPLITWLGHAAEGLFSLLLIVWFGLYAAGVALFVVGLGLKFIGGGTPEESRTVSTALLTASLPAPLFLTLVLCLWALFDNSFADMLATPAFQPWCSWLFPASAIASGSAVGFIGALINQSVPGFAFYLGVMVAAAALVLGGTLPSAVAELVPPDRNPPGELQRSRSLGRWLDSGFHAIDLAGVLTGVAFFMLPIGVAANYTPALQATIARTMSFMDIAGPLVGGSAVGFLAATKLFATSFSGFVQRLRVPVDVILDVDNWLRERPVGETVRLKVFARFTSLLRHVAERRLAGQPYDHIVIVAHSQGTVVALDTFRYLQSLPGGLLSRLRPCVILTMGCPLRQLYAWRLPSLYGWVLAGPPGAPPPSPHACGFAAWANAYGSGDYVGRNLWPTNVPFAPAQCAPPVPPAPQGEFCIGAAAHTHYFDEDHAEIGARISALI